MLNFLFLFTKCAKLSVLDSTWVHSPVKYNANPQKDKHEERGKKFEIYSVHQISPLHFVFETEVQIKLFQVRLQSVS